MANQCRAWSEALDPFEYSLSTHSDVATGASQMATAMRADLFDIDCAFYIAGPAALCRRCGPIWPLPACRPRNCTGRCWHELRLLRARPQPLTTAPAAAANPSHCACWATTWRPNSTTATSSSSSPMARCTMAASCWRRWMGSTTSASCWRGGDGWVLHALNPCGRGCEDLPLADLQAVRGVIIQKAVPGSAA
jgi:hypothetical protein